MDHVTGLLVAWLEEEGERQRRPVPLPPRVGDPRVRGWAHVAVCVVAGTLASGLFVCWLVAAWHRAGSPAPERLARWDFEVGKALTLEDVRVEGIVKAGRGPGPLTLIVKYRNRSLGCAFREEKAPWDIRVGDTVTIRSAAGRVAEKTDRVLLEDCEVVEEPRRPGEEAPPRPR
jgi:hypothetical protein